MVMTATPSAAGETATVDAVERIAHLSAREVNEHYLQKGRSRPVVLTGLAEPWPARRKWTLDFFKQAYGADRVIVTDFLGSRNLSKIGFSDYLDYVADPSIELLPGKVRQAPWYSPYWTPFIDHPELLDDFDVSPSVENWLPGADGLLHPQGSSEALMAEWALRGFLWLFIGPAGTVTPRHVDTLLTHAWNSQILGAKRFDFWAPGTPETVSEPDFSVNLHPGETLIIPAGWAHSVVALASSISLTGNFFNATNRAAFFRTIYAQPETWHAKRQLVPALKIESSA